MEKVVIHQARVIFPGSSFHGKTVDLRLRNGILTEMDVALNPQADEIVIQGNNLKLFPGFVDIGSEGGEPGLEHRESMQSLQSAARAGGFTHLAIMPTTQPVADNKSVIRFINSITSPNPHIWPMGALSVGCEGKDIAEYYELYEEGVLVFTDGDNSIQANDLLLRAMEYTSAFGGVILHHPEDKALAGKGMAHESLLAVKLGLKMKPALAETLQVRRDLELANFANTRLILHKLSMPESVELAEKFKQENQLNLAVTVSINNLLFNEKALEPFDSRFKLHPVLRSPEHQKGLWECVRNGLVDILVSDHRPRDIEEKQKEFDLALSGATGLETAIPSLFDHFYQELTEERWVELLSLNPRRWFGIPMPVLEPGMPVDFTLIESDVSWNYSSKNTHSLSVNSPWLEHTFNHKVVGTFYFNPKHS